MSPLDFFLTLGLLLGTLLLIFGMRYRLRQQQIKADLSRDEVLHDIAAKLNAAHAQTSNTLQDIQSRLSSIEKILKAVE